MTAPVLTETDWTLLSQWHIANELGDYAEADRLEKLIDATTAEQQQRLQHPAALASAARWYARCGVPIFPLVPGQKKPLTTNGFYDATADIDQVTRWWTSTPQANIGTPTGISFDVVDVDGPKGINALVDASLSLTNIGVPIIGHALTPRGGGHHLFVEPSGEGNATQWLPGIDYRGKGGYVVLAPSRGQRKNPITDEPTGETALYCWVTPLAQIKAAQA